MRVLASVEEDQLADVRPDHRAVLLYVGYARGVAKGQAAVLYSGDTVLGSATISGTFAPACSQAT